MTNHLPDGALILDPAGSRRDAENLALRASGPATPVDVLGVPAWAISDPEILKALLVDPAVSKDPRRHWPDFPTVIQTWPLALWVAVNNMFTAYGEDHARLRRMVAPAFTARRTTALTARVEQIVDDLLDDLAGTEPGEPADLRERFAYPLPIQVISHMLGLPQHAQAAFRTLVDGVFDTTLTAEEATANTGRLYGVLDDLIVTKRAQPGDDLTSLLISARDDEADDRAAAAMTTEELRDTLLLVVSAGYETTVNLVANSIAALLSHPDQLAAVHDGRATWSDVVEETLRYDPPVANLPMRYAVQDITLPDGTVIKQGDAILASYAAANRHPNWHQEPDTFDITRKAQQHLAFGHGVHRCLGAPLARLEGEVALRKFFARFPDAHVAVDPDDLPRVPSLISTGHQHLPVHLHAEGHA